jgi:hypothetical protein
MLQLTALEVDILGDMAWDSHFVGEIVGFVRTAEPLLDDVGVYRQTLELLESWTARGWLRVAREPMRPADPNTMEQLIDRVMREGTVVVSKDSMVAHVRIDLTDQAFLDVEWLRGAV